MSMMSNTGGASVFHVQSRTQRIHPVFGEDRISSYHGVSPSSACKASKEVSSLASHQKSLLRSILWFAQRPV